MNTLTSHQLEGVPKFDEYIDEKFKPIALCCDLYRPLGEVKFMNSAVTFNMYNDCIVVGSYKP